MSKFTEKFDETTVNDELRDKVKSRIRTNKNKRIVSEARCKTKPKKTVEKWKIAVIATVAIYAIMIAAFPLYVVIHNSLLNAKYDFSKARLVKTEEKLISVIDESNKNRPTDAMLQSGSVKESTVSYDFSAPVASKTNVQVDGMDEGDIIKNDGEYIYRLSPNGFSIIKTDNGNISKVCDIPIENFSPLEMYVRGSQLILVGGGYKLIPEEYKRRLTDSGDISCFSYHTNIEIRIFDISDAANPVQERYFQIEGDYHTSRISEEKGILYFLVNYRNDYYYNNFEESKGKRPYLRDDENAVAEPLPLEDIYYFKRLPGSSYMIIGAIDLNDKDSEVETKAYLGTTYVTYVSGENIYTGSWQTRYSAWGEIISGITHIAKFSLESLNFVGGSTVKGSLKDRYSMDEYNENLRVASSYNSSGTWKNAVYIFSAKMKKLDSITGIASGEAIDSVTFLGDKGYISTSVRFTFIDPLFIVDFSNPRHIKISQGLKEDGINNYMKAIDGTDYVIGIGTDSVELSSGSNRKTGLKIQLYDMSGEEAVSVAKLTIDGESSQAEALFNPKAILYMYDKDSKKGIIGFAAERAGREYIETEDDKYNYYAIKQQGFYLYYFDAEAGTLESYGFLSNFSVSENVYSYGYSNKSYSEYSWGDIAAAYSKYIKRGILIENYIYTVSDTVVTSYSLDGLNETHKLEEQIIQEQEEQQEQEQEQEQMI